MIERNGSGYVSPTENHAVHRMTRQEEKREWYAENPLPPRSPSTMDEDDLFEADSGRPINRWIAISEAQEQTNLMDWVRLSEGRYTELKLLFHVPNGGSRNKAEAAHLKKQGVKAGVPDLFLPVARGGYHGLFIEMKAANGHLMENQKTWIRKLRKQGYYAVVAWGFENAKEIIEEYLKWTSAN